MVFSQKFSLSDYIFFYATGDNNVVVLIYHTPDSEDTPESYILDKDVFDNIGDGMLKEKELKNGKICDDSDSRFVEEHEMDDDTYSLSDALEQHTIYIYKYI